MMKQGKKSCAGTHALASQEEGEREREREGEGECGSTFSPERRQVHTSGRGL